MTTSWNPSSVAGLEIEQVADGLVVYDPTSEQVHYLNSSAAAIMTLCDGDHDVAAIARTVQEYFGSSRHPATEVVTCVDELMRKGIVQ
ncbi:MAG: HPr-rel-A system PqqD family peptide chaperone [Desertimonas sp.]